MKQKRYTDCLNELEQVLHRMDPKNVKALYRRAQVLELLGKMEDALQTIEKFYKEHGTDETTKDGKLFKTLKTQVLKKIELDKMASQQLANKMVNQTTPKTQKQPTAPPVAQTSPSTSVSSGTTSQKAEVPKQSTSKT